MRLLGIAGKAGAGKDSLANALPYGVTIALADPIKRILYHSFDVDPDTLWGPSAARAQLVNGLNVRLALQILGDMGRAIDEDFWIKEMLNAAHIVLHQRAQYDCRRGVSPLLIAQRWAGYVIIPDVRFIREVNVIRNAGGIVVRLTREGARLRGEAAKHRSETDLDDASPSLFDCDFPNDGDTAKAENIAATKDILRRRGWLRCR